MAPLIEFFLRNYKKWIPIGLLGAAASFTYLFLLLEKGPVSRLHTTFIFLYLWVFFIVVLDLLFFRVILPRLALYSKRSILLFFFASLFGGLWLAHNIPIQLPPSALALFPSSTLFKLAFLIVSGIVIGMLLFAAGSFFATRNAPSVHVESIQRFHWWQYALPMLTVWLVYLLAYWPGMMSTDSMIQWQQVLTGQFHDHHPVFHTLTIWLVTRLFPSPASVAIAQLLSLSIIGGVVLSKFESQGVPPPVLWVASVLFAISPVNGTMVNTLWKDIPYSTAFLGYTFLVFLIAQSRGTWISKRGNWLILGIMAVLVTQFRHNGWPIILGTAVLLLLFYSRYWRRLLMSYAFCAALILLIQGPLYQVIHVEKSSVLIEASTSLYSKTALANPGTEMNAILESVSFLSQQPICGLATSLHQANDRNISTQPVLLDQKILNLLRHMPKLMLYYYRCNRSLVWLIWDPYGEVRNTSHVEVLVDPNPFGLQHNSQIPFLKTLITQFVVKTSKDPSINWLVWRPALYLYLFLWVVAVLAFKQKNMEILLVASPILLQSIASTVIAIPPNFRYHYAAYLIALLFWPVLFSKAPAPSESPIQIPSLNRTESSE